MRKTAWIFASAAITTGVQALAVDTGRLAPNSDQVSWARWQGRLSLGTTPSPWRLGVEANAVKLNSASLMGDYYFGRRFADGGRLGGFRATSGVMFGPRGVLSIDQPNTAAGSSFSIGSRPFGQASIPYRTDSAPDNAALPYVGIGYTGLSLRSGWAFSADLGLVAQSPGSAVRLGHAPGGSQNLDDVIRDMRLAPLLQFGVSYSF